MDQISDPEKSIDQEYPFASLNDLSAESCFNVYERLQHL